VIFGKEERMDKIYQAASSELGYSNNMTNLLVKKKENLVARILATQFHTKLAEDPGADKEVEIKIP